VDAYSTDDQTVESLRKWWAENGTWILAGLLLGSATLFGWRYWVEYRDQTYATASDAFEQVTAAARQGDIARAEALVVEIGGLPLATPYGDLSRLTIAAAAAESGDLDEAQRQLNMLLEGGTDNGITHLGRLRLARLQLAAGHLDQMTATLLVADPGPFAPLYAELRGDLALARGDREAAVAAYSEALASGDENIIDRAMLEMKLNDLGVSAVRDS
jgi:predicted negative regulator of RcsB-dependent stress response